MNDSNLELILDAMPGGLQILNEKGKCTHVNKVFLKMLGRKKADFIGKAFCEVSPPITSPKYSKTIATQIKKQLKTGESKSRLEIDIIDRSGKKIFVHFISNVLQDDKGKISGILCVFRDRTVEKQATEHLEARTKELGESEEWLSTMLRCIGDAIIATDSKGNVRFLNPVAESLTGWKQSDAIKKPVQEIFNIINEKSREEVENPVERAIREGVVVGLANHTILLSKDGKEIPIDDSGAPIKDKEGNITGAVLIFRDITERKKAEEELNIKDIAFCASLSAQSIADKNGIIYLVNPAFIELWGYSSSEEAIGNSVGSFFFNSNDVEPILKALTETGQWKGEFLAKKQDGSKFISQGFASAIYSDKGEHIGFQSANLNITERKKVEEELEQKTMELNERYKELNCLYGISKLKSKENLSLEDFIMKSVELIQPALQYPEITCARIILEEKEYKTANFKETQWCLNASIITRERKIGLLDICYLEEKPILFEGPFLKEERNLINSLAIFIGDYITNLQVDKELKKYSEQLEEMVETRSKQFIESENRLNEFINSSTEIFILLDSELNFKMINDIGLKFYGLTQKEFINRNISEIIPGFKQTARYKEYYNVIKTGISISFDDTITFNNREIVLNIRAFKVVEGLGLIYTDITEKHLAEEKLRKSEASLSLAQRIAHLGSWDLDIINNILTWSNEVYRMFDLTPQEFAATHEAFMERVHPDDREIVQAAVDKAWEDKGLYSIDHRIILKDDSERFVHEHAEIISDEHGNAIRMIGTVQDITEKKLLEEKIAKQEKLALLGRLVGGIGHELRNPLGSIKNAAYFLKLVIDDADPEVKETLTILEKEVNASEKIITNLLSFASTKPLVKVKININEIIEKTLAHIVVPNNIKIETRLSKKIPIVYADPDQLTQVLLNLINNGIQAIENEGKLIIKTSSKDSESIVIEISDTGIGMSKEVQKRLFEPLYTTKAKGIGLGLVITKTIIEKHNGNIQIQSEVSKGSTFTINLPIGLSKKG